MSERRHLRSGQFSGLRMISMVKTSFICVAKIPESLELQVFVRLSAAWLEAGLA